MATYSQTTVADLITTISSLLDDTGQVYWKQAEIQWAIEEALQIWAALTGYWRTRGVFTVSPTDSSPFYDLSVKLPALRTRTYTLGQMVQEIQSMLLEPPSGIMGTGMSGQVTIASILKAIQTARNRFVLDTHLPITYHAVPYIPGSSDGLATFPQASAYVHRVSWQDSASSTWINLWRTDAWAVDKDNPTWITNPDSPQQFSEAELAPLTIQVSPPPISAGAMDALTVDSLTLDLTSAATVFAIPDEWVWAVKYGALSLLLNSESQLVDPLRGEYAEQRYQQAVTFAKDARSIIRATVNGQPLNVDTLANLDASNPFWRNQSGTPYTAGALYDILSIPPADGTYSIACDVVQSAPIPIALGSYMPVGQEELGHIINYCTHILSFKCGGLDLKSTLPVHDSVMKAVAGRKAINAAKIKYLTPLLGQAQKEWAQRPDKVEANA